MHTISKEILELAEGMKFNDVWNSEEMPNHHRSLDNKKLDLIAGIAVFASVFVVAGAFLLAVKYLL